MSMEAARGAASAAMGASQYSPLNFGGVPDISIRASGKPLVRSANIPFCSSAKTVADRPTS